MEQAFNYQFIFVFYYLVKQTTEPAGINIYFENSEPNISFLGNQEKNGCGY